jgi:MinD-like ATPase involved in chromosome partitioning or flagellar assembly
MKGSKQLTKIISIHSFRGGTGKSNTTANVAYLLASEGKRVGVIDTDIQSPGIHVLFGLDGAEISTSLNDYLWHDQEITDTAIDVTQNFESIIEGKLYLIPSSVKPAQITRVLREGYDAKRLTQGLRKLVDGLSLDVLLIDTHPGLNEETLLSLVISQTLVIIMRPDKQDYEGTGITIEVARQLEVPRMVIVVNKAPTILEPEAIKMNVEQTYKSEVVAVIPHSDEMMNLASEGIFAERFPEHSVTSLFKQVSAKLLD